MLVTLAGPLTNLVIMYIAFLTKMTFLGIPNENIVYSNLIIAIFNLIPIYPLDGGRIIRILIKILKNYEESIKLTNKISNVTIIIITMITSIIILYIHNIAFVIILIYLWFLVLQENRYYKLQKRMYKIIANEKDTNKICYKY